jgi:ABC-2 type transport system ATP-binding protein
VTAALSIRGLGKDYGALRAVDALDLDVPAGEIFGLLGPNGAGKTTAISMVAGVLTPSRGTAAVAGHDIESQSFAARGALGLVPQDLAIYEDLTARQNLHFFGSLYGLSGSLLRERIDWALDVARLADRARERVSGFSGGMKRRLNLVAGLLHKPALLILDEPTVGVDPQSRAHIFDTVRALRDDGTTVLYTSHYMEEVQGLCDRVAIMDRGAVIASDTVDGLITAHAGGAMEVRVAGDPQPLAAALAAVGAIEVHGDALHVKSEHTVGEVAAAVEAAGGTVRSIRTFGADLESVFLALTGHALRDD